jgi:hypothetical protein
MPRLGPLSLAFAVVAAAALAAAACGRGADDGAEGSAPASTSAAEADTLGRELHALADVVASYQASHSGRRIASLRQLGLDSLAPRTVRRLHRRGDTLLLEVAYRRPGARSVLSCVGTTDLLEDATLHGAFPALCRGAGGAVDTFTVSPAPTPRSTARNG